MTLNKSLIVSGTFALALGALLWTNSELAVDAKKDEKVISYHGEVKLYDDLRELEKNAPIIVQATFTGKRETIPSNLTEGIVFRSDSTLKISKVFEGNLEENDRIIVYEPAIIDDEGNYFSINGYNLMNENDVYTLFLTPVDDFEGYAIAGLYQGKFNNSIDRNVKSLKRSITANDLNEVDYFGEDVDHYNRLKEQVLDKYNTEN